MSPTLQSTRSRFLRPGSHTVSILSIDFDARTRIWKDLGATAVCHSWHLFVPKLSLIQKTAFRHRARFKFEGFLVIPPQWFETEMGSVPDPSDLIAQLERLKLAPPTDQATRKCLYEITRSLSNVLEAPGDSIQRIMYLVSDSTP